MKYCEHCGAELLDDAVICPKCGCKCENKIDSSTQTIGRNATSNQTNGITGESVGWFILGFCIPLVGLILYLVWKDSKPSAAKAIGLGALIGFCLNVLSGVSCLF